jgi:hypothetical protein
MSIRAAGLVRPGRGRRRPGRPHDRARPHPAGAVAGRRRPALSGAGRAVRPPRRTRQSPRSRRRRRRLRHQTLRHGRTPRPHARRPPPRHTGHRNRSGHHRRVHRRPCRQTGHHSGRRGPPHPHRMAPARSHRPGAGPTGHPPAVAAAGVDPATTPKPTTCVSASPTCAANSNPTRPDPATSSPNPGIRRRPGPPAGPCPVSSCRQILWSSVCREDWSAVIASRRPEVTVSAALALSPCSRSGARR